MEPQSVPDRVRGRILFACLAVSLLVSLGLVAVLWPSWLTQTMPVPLPDAVFGLTWYALLYALLIRLLGRSGGRLRTLVGVQLGAVSTPRAIGAGVALLAISVACVYTVYLPLSYIAPAFVQWWLIDDPMILIWTQGEFYQLANGLNFVVVVLVAPFVEELFFRGLLLPSWASKWSLKRAVVLSSLAFALLHADILGGFLFGVVAAIAFLKTQSLWVPFVIHATNNGLAWLITLGEVIFSGEHQDTLVEFQTSWWLAPVGLCIGVPLLILVSRYTGRSARPIGAA